ncbi:c-type cytochrome [Roseovarius rhodophyticola]|uniref:Cytochrome c n=1 Tax=Roseovarius rhodophyticola TaxID=3080827 RepID=A0ABZ2TEE5_9RHOB|nr:cytochrome c [Roseovarius sp. W115]MDV2928268.1 cytochrome c [Roseovarius sp. W115]
MACFLVSPLNAQDADNGRDLFYQHCAMCHGRDATGNGPMAPALILQPPDLTQLQNSNGGFFPIARVIRKIDGRDPLVSHGSPMPIYGQFFEGRDVAVKTKSGQPIMTSQPIVDLVEWLKSVQQ